MLSAVLRIAVLTMTYSVESSYSADVMQL